MTDAQISQLRYFTKEEIAKTDANISGLQFPLFQRLDLLRNRLGRKIRLLRNGLNTGNHKSIEHSQGLACDFYLDPRDGEVDYYFVFKCAIDCGFNKIGIYWNGLQYSFHLAIAQKAAFWSATKTKTGEPWKFDGLIVDPAKKQPVSSPLAATTDPE